MYGLLLRSMTLEKNIASTRKRKFFRGAKIAVLLYAAVGISVFYLQDRFFFHPTSLPPEASFTFSQPHKEVNIAVDANTNYSLVQFTTTEDSAKGVVLYFHGNTENVNHYANVTNSFTKQGYEVWMIDYPGFGKSTGELTEAAMYQQGLELYKMSRSRFSPSQIIIYGRSMGSGVAAQLASIRDCKRLILETPYYSLPSVAARYFWMYPVDQMIKYKLPTNEFLVNVTAPVTIFHGTEDEVIPYTNASKLKQVLKAQDEFITIDGGSHNNLNSYPQLQSRIQRILDPAFTSATSL